MYHSHFKPCVVLWLGALHVTFEIQVCQLSTFCFPALLDSASWDSEGILRKKKLTDFLVTYKLKGFELGWSEGLENLTSVDTFHKCIKPFPDKPRFLCVCSTSLLKTLQEKGEITQKEQFPLFPQCFVPFW